MFFGETLMKTGIFFKAHSAMFMSIVSKLGKRESFVNPFLSVTIRFSYINYK